MITLTKEQLINYIELLAEKVYWNTTTTAEVDEDDYCKVISEAGVVNPDNTVIYVFIEGYILTVFTELEQRYLKGK